MKFNQLWLFLFSFLLSISIFAQDRINIKGTAVDEILQLPVEEATVYLSLKKDSTVVDYSLTDLEGNFNLQVRKINEPVFFIVSDELNGEFTREFESLTEDLDLGEIQLINRVDLEGVVITGAPPIRIKTDTLEFNASSFKVRPDANVEGLLKQLPGVEVDE